MVKSMHAENSSISFILIQMLMSVLKRLVDVNISVPIHMVHSLVVVYLDMHSMPMELTAMVHSYINYCNH